MKRALGQVSRHLGGGVFEIVLFDNSKIQASLLPPPDTTDAFSNELSPEVFDKLVTYMVGNIFYGDQPESNSGKNEIAFIKNRLDTIENVSLREVGNRLDNLENPVLCTQRVSTPSGLAPCSLTKNDAAHACANAMGDAFHNGSDKCHSFKPPVARGACIFTIPGARAICGLPVTALEHLPMGGLSLPDSFEGPTWNHHVFLEPNRPELRRP